MGINAKKTGPLLTAGVMAFSTSWTTAAPQDAQRKAPLPKATAKVDDGKFVQKVVEPWLNDPMVMHINTKGAIWRAGEFGVVNLPPEAADHPEGVFRMEEVMAHALRNSPSAFALNGTPKLRVLTNPSKILSEEECRQIALKFMRKAYPWFEKMGPLPKAMLLGTDETGRYSFSWARFGAHGFRTAMIVVDVRAMDGKVVGFEGYPIRIRELQREYKITPLQARRVALRAALADKRGRNPRVVMWLDDLSNTHDGMAYTFYIEAVDAKTGKPVEGQAEVDVKTGRLTSWLGYAYYLAEAARHAEEKRQLEYQDTGPVWAGNKLIFISKMPIAGLPHWVECPPQVVLRDGKGKFSHITADLKSASYIILSSLPGSPWIGMARGEGAHALNLDDGRHYSLSETGVEHGPPAITSNGSWGVSSAIPSDDSGKRGWVDGDLRSMSLPADVAGVRRAWAQHRGHEQTPIFSPDGKWLYFVTEQWQGERRRGALNRVAVQKVQVGQDTSLEKGAVETVIAHLPELGVRMSFFPDGKRLLLQTLEGMFVMSLSQKKASPLVFENLHDKGLGGLNIREIEDGWAGPGNNRVTFSGLTQDKKWRRRRRIYSCTLTGKDVVTYSVARNQPIPAYAFPQNPDVTVTDVAKKWALHEMEIEDTRKRALH